MQKTKPSITMEGKTAIFNDGRGRIVRAVPDQLRTAFHVHSGTALWANDEEFWILEFDKALVIVPDNEENFIYELSPAWKKNMVANNKGLQAGCEIPPVKYRKKLLGFLPCVAMKFTITTPDKLSDFDGWQILGPLDYEAYFNLEKKENDDNIT